MRELHEQRAEPQTMQHLQPGEVESSASSTGPLPNIESKFDFH